MTIASFGIEVLKTSTILGKHGKKLDPRKLAHIKHALRIHTCNFQTDEEFKEVWSDVVLNCISEICKNVNRYARKPSSVPISD